MYSGEINCAGKYTPGPPKRAERGRRRRVKASERTRENERGPKGARARALMSRGVGESAIHAHFCRAQASLSVKSIICVRQLASRGVHSRAGGEKKNRKEPPSASALTSFHWRRPPSRERAREREREGQKGISFLRKERRFSPGARMRERRAGGPNPSAALALGGGCALKRQSVT